MSDISAVLPQNRTALEAAIADTIGCVPQPAQVISTLYRPSDISPALLPWLAWSVDVLAWPRRANMTTQRRLTAGSWRLHRLQGTLAGFREIAGVFGGEIVGAITPPAKLFAAPALTREERNAFVARYPQLRIYRHRTVGRRVGLHCGDALGRRPPAQSDALLRLTPRAYLWREGTETELSAIERTSATAEKSAVTVTEVRAPGSAAGIAFCGAHPRYLTHSDAAARIYRLRIEQAYQDSRETLRRTTATPGLEPLDVRADAVAQPGHANGIHAGRFIAGHIAHSTARDRIYQRLYLFDESIQVLHRHAALYVGAGRLGMPAHHAELTVRLTGAATPQSAGRYCRGYLTAADKSGLTECLAALRDVARASDRIDINTAVTRPARAGAASLSGSITAGDWTAYH